MLERCSGLFARGGCFLAVALLVGGCGRVTDPWTLTYSGALTGQEEGVRAVWLQNPGIIGNGEYRLSIDLYEGPAERRGPFDDPRVSLAILDYETVPVLEDLRIWGVTGDTPCTPDTDDVVIREVEATLDLDVTATLSCPELPMSPVDVVIEVRPP